MAAYEGFILVLWRYCRTAARLIVKAPKLLLSTIAAVLDCRHTGQLKFLDH